MKQFAKKDSNLGKSQVHISGPVCEELCLSCIMFHFRTRATAGGSGSLEATWRWMRTPEGRQGYVLTTVKLAIGLLHVLSKCLCNTPLQELYLSKFSYPSASAIPESDCFQNCGACLLEGYRQLNYSNEAVWHIIIAVQPVIQFEYWAHNNQYITIATVADFRIWSIGRNSACNKFL
jgi:hypothetical protein